MTFEKKNPEESIKRKSREMSSRVQFLFSIVYMIKPCSELLYLPSIYLHTGISRAPPGCLKCTTFEFIYDTVTKIVTPAQCYEILFKSFINIAFCEY
jgi:hypothetical protein